MWVTHMTSVPKTYSVRKWKLPGNRSRWRGSTLGHTPTPVMEAPVQKAWSLHLETPFNNIDHLNIGIMWTRTYIRNHPFPSHIRLSLHALTRQKSWFNPWLNMPYIDLPFPPHWYMPLTHLCHLSKWLNCGQTKSAQSTFNCNMICSTSKIESKSLKIIGNQCTQRFLWVGWS